MRCFKQFLPHETAEVGCDGSTEDACNSDSMQDKSQLPVVRSSWSVATDN
jgi:hypothetical protein